MLHLDLDHVLARAISPAYGITEHEFASIQTIMLRYLREWRSEAETGQHAWTLETKRADLVQETEVLAAEILESGIETVLWVGIGGSGLGPRVLQEVFESQETVEFIVVDTVDPSVLREICDVVNWRRTAVVVVSKSGETLESMSAFFVFYDELKKAIGKRAAERVIALTDPASGSLRAYSTAEGFRSLPIPPAVGGRYSIFTPVGLLPLALLGIPLQDFLQGAREMLGLCLHPELAQNPAALLATVQYALDRKGNLLRVIMPYSTKLQSMARWDQQLIAESLGKNEIQNPFPVAAVGTQDQHSLLQQWMQGPRRAWHLFINVVSLPDLPIPTDIPKDWAMLQGRNAGDVLSALYEGTSRGLTEAKRPHVTITLPTLDALHLGQLFMLFMAEVILLSKLYRIDPYGQPGVERSKVIAKEFLAKKE